jgi:DNA topoisomerase-1
VVATVVHLLEKSLIRVGNQEYADANRSFGLTTMLNRHVNVEGWSIQFNFMGKSKVRHSIEVHDRRLARVVKKIQDLPGQELFQYLDEQGQPSSISSADVNAYLQDVAGEEFTAKDFRTWWGTLLALLELAGQDVPTSKMDGKRAISAVMSTVAKQLGNTPAICRKSYVHPVVLKAFLEGSLPASPKASTNSVDKLIASTEKTLIDLLRRGEAKTKAA